MSQDFSDFVRSLGPTGEPSDAALDELWTALRRRLRRVLQRRGLWDRPPSYLGLTDHSAWTTPRTADRSGFPMADQDALDELTTDFYVEMFVKRLSNLRRYAARGDNLEKVIRLGAGQFIQERQRENDRLGYRLFHWLRAALAQAVTHGRLHILSGGVKIRNDTVFGFNPQAAIELAPDDALAAVVRTWNDELLHDWVSARGPAVTALIGRLEDHLPGLRQTGIEVFGFKPLVDAFKRDVRDRFAVFLDDRHATISEDPLRPSEERQGIEELSTCVEAGLRGGGGQQRTRDKLLKLWQFLVAFALTAADPERARGAGAALMAALQAEDLPSHRQLSRLLGIRHDRIPALLARIKEEVERCLETLGRSRPTVASALRWGHHETPGDAANTDTLDASAGTCGSEANLDETRDLRQELKRLTAEAYRRDVPATPAAAGPEPGVLYHLEACPEPGVEWLLIEVEVATGAGLVIPADSLPLLGSSDLAVTVEPGGLLSIRCDLGVWLGSDVLRGDRRTAALAASDLDRVLARRHGLAAGDDAAASEIDVDPDYRGWRRSLEAARNAVARVYGGRVQSLLEAVARPAVSAGKVVPMKSREYSRPSWQLVAAAASFVVASGALVTYLVDQRSELTALRARLEIERQPESAIPWLLAPLGTRRGGSPEELVVPPEARSIGLLIDAANGDRLEIRDAAGDEVWSTIVERIDSPDEALVRIPVERMPPGEYGVKVWRGDVLNVDFEVRIESP